MARKSSSPKVSDATAVITAKWRQKPAKHDYPAAEHYLGLIADPPTVQAIVAELAKQPVLQFRANDILRAARLELLPLEDSGVSRDLTKMISGESWAPVLLVRGDVLRNYPLTIADGYHRVCASYHLSEDTTVPCQIVDLPVREKVPGS